MLKSDTNIYSDTTNYILVDGEWKHKDKPIEPEHFHCPICQGNDFMFVGWTKVCKPCYFKNDKSFEMQLCTYGTCVSS